MNRKRCDSENPICPWYLPVSQDVTTIAWFYKSLPSHLPTPASPTSLKREKGALSSRASGKRASIPRASRSLGHIRRRLGLDAHTPSGFCNTDSPQRTSGSLYTSGAFVVYEWLLLPPGTETVPRMESLPGACTGRFEDETEQNDSKKAITM